jgi:hypothetical protein
MQLVIAGLVHIIFFAVIVYFLYRMKVERCECALMDPYNKLYITSIVLLGLRVVMLFASLFVGKEFVKYSRKHVNLVLAPMVVWTVILSVVYIAYFISSIIYLNKLRTVACTCSDNSMRYVYYLYSWFMLFMLFFTVMVLVWLTTMAFK